MDNFDPNSLLVPFLRNLAENIEKGNLNQEELQKVGDFYMSYIFNDQEKEMSNKEFLKFFAMGWYVYQQLLKVENVNP